jgi:hypothetical protein
MSAAPTTLGVGKICHLQTERGRVPAIEIILKNSSAALSAAAFDDRSTPDTSVFIGLKNEVIVVPKDNIAALVMTPDAAKEYFGD